MIDPREATCACWLGDPGATGGSSDAREACAIHGLRAEVYRLQNALAAATTAREAAERERDHARQSAAGRERIWEERADVAAKYQELLTAVGNKYQGESRHETALRYIQQAETHFDRLASAKEK